MPKTVKFFQSNNYLVWFLLVFSLGYAVYFLYRIRENIVILGRALRSIKESSPFHLFGDMEDHEKYDFLINVQSDIFWDLYKIQVFVWSASAILFIWFLFFSKANMVFKVGVTAGIFSVFYFLLTRNVE